MKLLKLEFYKLRRKKIILTILMFLIVLFVLGTWEVKTYNQRGMNAIWEYLIYLYTTVNTFIMPILIAVIASRISDLEHKGLGFKQLLTQVSATNIYTSKYICSTTFIIFVAISEMIQISIIGLYLKAFQPYPIKLIMAQGLATLLASLPVLALQLAISMLVKNQMIALVTGLAGGFIGLMSLFFSSDVSRLFLWSYYAQLSSITPKFTSEIMQFEVNAVPINLFFIACILGSGIFLLGNCLFSRREW